MALSPELEQRLDQELKEMSTTEKRPYISGFERRAAERAAAIAAEQALQQALQRSQGDLFAVLTTRFGPVEDEIREKIARQDNSDRLSGLFVKAVSVGSLQEFHAELDRPDTGFVPS